MLESLSVRPKRPVSRRNRLAALSGFLCLCLTGSLSAARADTGTPIVGFDAEARKAARATDRLFTDEIQQATQKLKWRGERLTEDSLYAVALTGTSWESVWGKDRLFSLAWGDCRKVPTLGKRNSRNYDALIDDIKKLYERKDYRKAVDTATANFSLDEIGCDSSLKEPVGNSLMALGQPEQAFPIFSAPFEPPHSLASVSEENRRFRLDALQAADQGGLKKEAVAFALSLLLDPDTETSNPDLDALRYLEKAGVDIDRVLLGILQAPEKLRGLPGYYYAAADLMAYRASPRLLPFLLQLAGSPDTYLRSRALLGLGVVSYQIRAQDPAGWNDRVVLAPLREYGLSAGERKLVSKELHDGANSDKFRIRAAAALALALIGEPESLPLLEKLAKDRAFVLLADPTLGDKSKVRHLLFPVRMAAAAALARYGIAADPGGGALVGKELDNAKRGGQDETNDRRNLRHDIDSQIAISPVDAGTGVPMH